MDNPATGSQLMTTRDLHINAGRLHGSLDRMAEIGATASGGVTRLALSDEDRAGRDLLRGWMEAAGLSVRWDDLGNLIGRRAGRQDQRASLLLGSHCDSVREGGRFDGTLGVLGALEVVHTLNDAGLTTERPIEVISWTNEEGARFEPAMLCSGVVAGAFERDYVYGRTDADGLRFEDELRRIGYLGEERNRPAAPFAYLELHIEQGPVLEDKDVPVGIVEGITGISWLEVRVSGQSDHAGPTPMRLRHDALVAAARMIDAADGLARGLDEQAVGTVGRLALEPNILNVIPGRVVFSVDLRHPEADVLEQMVASLKERCEAIATATGVEVAIDRFWTSEPTPFDSHVVAAVSDAVQKVGLPSERLWSGAGHDAKYVAEIDPTGMIFVRSQGGLSHCPQEYSSPEDIEAGVNVLLQAALRLANQ